jgi:hypothetical protein
MAGGCAEGVNCDPQAVQIEAESSGMTIPNAAGRAFIEKTDAE